MAQRLNYKSGQITALLVLALATGGCATLQPPSATGPRGNEPVYPVLFVEDPQRREAALVALNLLTQSSVNSGAPELQPITATIASLPANPSRPLTLPKLGIAAEMNEEETRESLRRFIKEVQELIGADPTKLSLVDRPDQPDGSKLATYEQRPFRYPIRGAYGKLQIHFLTDRRVLNISSTCIPDTDRIQAALAAVAVKLTAEDAVKQLRENDITYTNAQGTNSSLRVPAASELKPRELVTYVRPSPSRPALEFHVAWEVEVSNAPIKTAYVDAFKGEIIAAQ